MKSFDEIWKDYGLIGIQVGILKATKTQGVY